MLLVKRRDKYRSRSNMEHIGVLGLEVLVETNMFLFGRLAHLIITYQLFTLSLHLMNFSPFSVLRVYSFLYYLLNKSIITLGV